MQALFKSTGMTLMSNVGGASGPLYGFGFIKMASAVNDEIDHDNLKTYLKRLLMAFNNVVKSN